MSEFSRLRSVVLVLTDLPEDERIRMIHRISREDEALANAAKALIAYYDVDERGNAKLLGFNETSDRGFNKRLRDVLRDVRFRPATRLDGRAVRDTGMFAIDYP